MRRLLLVVAVVAGMFVAVPGPVALGASQSRHASAWSSPDPVLWFPLPPASPNPLGPPDDTCVEGSSSPGGAIAFFTFPAFTIPAGDVIQGVEVKPKYRTNDSHFIQLTDGGATIGSEKSLPQNFPGQSFCSSTSIVAVGGAADLWGAGGALTAAKFNAGSIGVRVREKIVTLSSGDSGSIPLSLDSIELIVHHGPANSPPTADAGGPYTVAEGGTVVLSGAGSSDPDQSTVSLTFEWDLDNDGAYDDATGISPTFSAAGRNGPASQTIGLRVTDNGALTDTDTATVTINNVAPQITSVVAAPSSIDEAQSVTVSGTFTDPAVLQETHTGTAAWSDGASTTLTVGDGTFSTSRTFPDDDPTATPSDTFTVVITIDDGDGGSDTETSPTITVNNVDPTIGSIALSAASIDEGDTVTVSGSFSDPGVPDTFSGASLWSDGASSAVTLGAGTFSLTRTFVDDDPTGTPADTFDVDVTITDDDTGSDTATSPTLTVNNVDPVITSLAVTPTIDEDGTVSLSGTFTDVGVADTHTVTVDWGEGAPEAAAVVQGAGSGSFSASHQYLDDDPTGTPQDLYTITVTVTDDDTGSATDTVQTLVNNVDPAIDSVASDATFEDKAEENEPVTVSGAFSDVGTLDTHTATVDWGDGTVTPAAIVEAGGSGTFSATYAYPAGGVYTVTVTLVDDDTGTATATTTAVVTGVGVNGGVLQVVGTAGDDHVEVKTVGSQIDVFASFVSPKHRRFAAAGISAVEVYLCEGDDHGDVHQSISLPATIHGDDGDDMLWGGSAGDEIFGGPGNDKLWGRDGDDLLDGGPDNDKLFGGKGANTLID